MASPIRSIANGGSSSIVEPIMITEQVSIEETTNDFVTLLSENSFALSHRTDENIFVLLTPVTLNPLTNSSFSGYQWTTMYSGNKELSILSGYSWYGIGVYVMVGKGYSYPSSMEVPYPLTDSSAATNYSYLNIDENGNVQIYICSYDIIASGDYIVTIGLK